jgi:hypothetical protein
MKRDTIIPMGQFNSSFLSCEKDTETILQKLFVTSKPYSDMLKRLLIINMPDCLTNKESQLYKEKISMSLKQMIDNGYIKLEPKLRFGEYEEVKAYILLSFDNFTTNASNPKFRDCTVTLDIICHTDYWKMDNYQMRPLKIAGYIDGILNEAKLSGIGTFNFIGCNELIIDENLSGYSLCYRAVHGSDDIIPPEKED